ncbi:hypothetical protein BDW59DRAFT_149689 [Aspergillus cavernicola]|uniref:Uncharacterized protein n=1 Tax=Aspergillus cavernicola TaxID=176166 RepID=A0ABR4I305_9EURO
MLPWTHEICSWYRRSPRIFTTPVVGISTLIPVGGIPGSLTWGVVVRGEQTDRQVSIVRSGKPDLQPVDHLIMGELEYEFANDSSIVCVLKDEVVAIEIGQLLVGNATSQLRKSAAINA